MKYLDPKFSTPANSRAYVDGWERCFGEDLECKHCGDVELKHQCDHPDLCCWCFDLSWFPEALDQLNEERAAKGKLPMRAWPIVSV